MTIYSVLRSLGICSKGVGKGHSQTHQSKVCKSIKEVIIGNTKQKHDSDMAASSQVLEQKVLTSLGEGHSYLNNTEP